MMIDTRIITQILSTRRVTSIIHVCVFMVLSAVCWLVFNRLAISLPEGFDPVRYEYFARNGLPEFLSDSSSYRIVLLLEQIYKYLPYYWGYVIFIGFLSVLLTFSDVTGITRLAMFSPISFYYFGQTGKDGIAILSMLAAATIFTGTVRLKNVILIIVLTGLAYFVRPAILLFLPVVFFQFRFGTLYAIFLSVGLAYTFMIISDFYAITDMLSGTVTSNETGAETAILRQYTFGYELDAVVFRISLLMFSILFQPFLGFFKSYNSGELYIMLDAICTLLFAFILIKNKIMAKFIFSAIPYVISIGFASPFYHFRYLAIAYPVILVYSMNVNRMGLFTTDSVYNNILFSNRSK